MTTPSTQVDRASASDCQVLLDMCTPFIYIHNAFRITGLPCDATTRDIKRRVDDLKAANDLGDAVAEHTHAFALTPPPSSHNIRDAANRLHDPQCRIIDEFFWFWPYEWGTGYDDPALSPIRCSDKDHAFELWRAAESCSDPTERVVAVHNLAVMYHLVALDSEQVALRSDLDAKQLSTIATYWREAFKRWENLTEDEVFWSYITTRIRAMGDPRLTTGFARRLRYTFPEALDRINAHLAVSFAENSKFQLASKHVAYMRETHAGQDNIENTLASIVKPIRDRILTAVSSAVSVSRKMPKNAHAAVNDLINATREPLQVLEVLYDAQDHQRMDLFDEVADACLKCQIAYGRATEDWSTCQRMLTQALSLAHSDEVKNRLQENLAIVSQNDSFEEDFVPLVEAIQELADKETSSRNRYAEYQSSIVPQIDNIARQNGPESDVYVACCDAAAQFLVKLSVEAHNSEDDDDTALAAIRAAAQIAHDPEIKTRLQNDVSILENIVSMSSFTQNLRTILDRPAQNSDKLSAISAKTSEQLHRISKVSDKDDVLTAAIHALRALTIKSCNEHQDYALAMQAITSAIGLLDRLTKRDQQLVDTLHQVRASVLKNKLIADRVDTSMSAANKPGPPPVTSGGKSFNPGCLIAVVIGVAVLIIYAFVDDNSSSSSSSSARPRSTYTAPAQPTFNQPALALPYNGTIKRFSTAEAIAPLRIVTRNDNQNYFVKIEEYSSGRDIATVFVRSGQSVDIDVPLGSYRLKYAAGSTWYGESYLFGPSTAYSKADERFDFSIVGNQVSGYTVELYLRPDGNLKTSKISPSEF